MVLESTAGRLVNESECFRFSDMCIYGSKDHFFTFTIGMTEEEMKLWRAEHAE